MENGTRCPDMDPLHCVVITSTTLSCPQGHLELGRNAVIAEGAGDETVVDKHLENGPVDDRTERDRLVLSKWLLCCGEVKRRHGGGA